MYKIPRICPLPLGNLSMKVNLHLVFNIIRLHTTRQEFGKEDQGIRYYNKHNWDQWQFGVLIFFQILKMLMKQAIFINIESKNWFIMLFTLY